MSERCSVLEGPEQKKKRIDTALLTAKPFRSWVHIAADDIRNGVIVNREHRWQFRLHGAENGKRNQAQGKETAQHLGVPREAGAEAKRAAAGPLVEPAEGVLEAVVALRVVSVEPVQRPVGLLGPLLAAIQEVPATFEQHIIAN
eukprot:scaffold111721_cov47-Prasinocladus_malaysianus.AAC.5